MLKDEIMEALLDTATHYEALKNAVPDGVVKDICKHTQERYLNLAIKVEQASLRKLLREKHSTGTTSTSNK